MSEQESNKWNIPYGITYEKLSKILKGLHQKKGDLNKVSFDSILSLSGLHKNFLSTNLSFLKSINTIEGDNSEGYKITDLGKKFADALYLDKEEDIKNCLIELITKSHLNDLKIYIETEGDSLSKDGILKFIKRNARISDGPATGNMPKSSAQGAYALIDMFNKAKIITDELTNIRSQVKPASSKSTKEKRTNKKDTHQSELTNQDSFTLGSDTFSIQINKKISKDDFEFIKNQIMSWFDYVKKKIDNNNSEQTEFNEN